MTLQKNSHIANYGGKQRDSSFELYRIIVMLSIIASHYVVNSGIIRNITQSNVMEWNSVFALLFGFGGKIGINCFVLLSGYFMCTSTISLRKFLKLIFEVEFYRIAFFLIFLLSGYTEFAIVDLQKAIFPLYGAGTGFVGSYLIFYLFIPFLNAFIRNIKERDHIAVIGICLTVNTVMPTFLLTSPIFTYVGWFMVLYFIASYVRLYPKQLSGNHTSRRLALIFTLFLAWGSVFGMAVVCQKTGNNNFYYFVKDVHKIFAVTTSVTVFMFFKDMRLKYNPFINKLAASSFGVF